MAFVIGLALVASGPLLMTQISIRAQLAASYLLSVGRIPLAQLERNQFHATASPANVPSQNHSHGAAASHRSDALSFINAYASNLGRRVHHYQVSAAVQRQSRLSLARLGRSVLTGFRSYFWAKDLASDPSDQAPRPGDVEAIVDVDYYLDMNAHLASSLGPVLVSTIVPEKVGDSVDGCSHYFKRDGMFHMDVTGGGEFDHRLWHWPGDSLIATKTVWGIPYASVIFHVERRYMARHRAVVGFFPSVRLGLVRTLVALATLYAPRLARVDAVEVWEDDAGNEYHYAVLNVVSATAMDYYGQPTTHFTSLGICDNPDSVCIPTALFNHIKLLHRRQGPRLAVASAETIIKLACPALSNPTACAALLTEYFSVSMHKQHVTVYANKPGPRTYSFSPISYGVKDSMVAFMKPLIDEAYSPSNDRASEERAVSSRITDFQADDVPVTPKLESYMESFLSLLVPDSCAHSLHPTTVEDVYEKQARPAQRIILDQAGLIGAPVARKIKSFIKKESGGAPGDPRVISTIDGHDKLHYSRYIYAVTEYMSRFAWCMIGKTPREIAERVAAICSSARHNVVSTDFSRMDGRIKRVLRELERRFLMRLYDPQYHAQLDDLMKAQFDLRGITPTGVRYNTGSSRASGSPETAVFNTLATAFVSYMAAIESSLFGTHASEREAFDSLGAYMGDDGISHDIEVSVYSHAASMVGQVLTCDEYKPGDAGVTFLSRVFGPDVWTGSPDSMCDLPRQLSKLHTTVALPANVSAGQRLLEKMTSYYYMDLNTPVLGDMVKQYFAVTGYEPLAVDSYGLRHYHAVTDADERFPNTGADWMQDWARRALPLFDFGEFTKWLRICATVSDFLSPPLCQRARRLPGKVPVLVDDEIIRPGEPNDEIPPPKPDAPVAAAAPVSVNAVKPDKHTEPAVSLALRKEMASIVEDPPCKIDTCRSDALAGKDVCQFHSDRAAKASQAKRGRKKNVSLSPVKLGVVLLLALLAVAGGASPVDHHSLSTHTPNNIITQHAWDIKLPDATHMVTTTKRDKSKKKDKHVQQPNRQKQAKATKVRIPRQFRDAAANDYMLTLADPGLHKGARVPDTNTLPSATFCTTLDLAVNTDTNGHYVVAIEPLFNNGGLRAGIVGSTGANPGSLGLLAGPNDLPVGYVSASIFNVLSLADIAAISSTFASVRPVSASLEWIPTANALNASGMACGGTFPREQFVCKPSPPGMSGTDMFNSAFAFNVPAFSSVNDILSSEYVQSIGAVQPLKVLWKPEDYQSWTYRSTGTGVTTSLNSPNSAPVAFSPWLSANNTGLGPPVGSGLPDLYYLPFLTGQPPAPGQAEVPSPLITYPGEPWMLFALIGGQVSSVVGQLRITINWEGIAVSTGSNIVSAKISPNNPLELAQASNVIAQAPDVVFPTIPQDPGTQVLTAIAKGATHLYDGAVPQKKAISGESIFDKLGDVASKIPWGALASGALALL